MRFPLSLPIHAILSSNSLLAMNFSLRDKDICQYGLGLQGSKKYL
jgi:hypothetical protein